MLRIPISYHLRSIWARLPQTSVAILGIAGVVAVFIATLALANGFEAALSSSGSPENAMVRRGGSNSEMESSIELNALRIVSDFPEIQTSTEGQPMVSAEVVVIAALPLITTGTDANVQVRGVSASALSIRPKLQIIEGRSFTPGLPELLVGKNARSAYSGLKIGELLPLGGQKWRVVGTFDSGGSAFDSEIWCDAMILNQAYSRPTNLYQSITLRLSPSAQLETLGERIAADPRLDLTIERETAYYDRQSQMLSSLIRVLGFMVANIMAVGAIFGALNTMFASMAERSSEIATLRAIGYQRIQIIASFTLESMLIALIGSILGCLLVTPLNGFTTSTINWSTFSHMAFAFRVTPTLYLSGILFGLGMGLIGGLIPSIVTARKPIALVLRGL
jgi:putative ABC transport system permease protein